MPAGLIQASQFSAITGVLHGFTTREGGVSEGPYASLNLSMATDDLPENVRENRRRVLAAIGRPDARFVSVRQVHGASVVQVTSAASRAIEADGIWTRDRGAVLAVLVADCVPVLFSSLDGTAIGAVHAGWRGTQKKIPGVMVEQMSRAGIEPSGLRVVLGPALSQGRFEIGPEVETKLHEAFPNADGAIVPGSGDRFHADLWALNVQTLLDAGVPRDSIEVLRVCSATQPELFSHRRDLGVTGRQAGVIALA